MLIEGLLSSYSKKCKVNEEEKLTRFYVDKTTTFDKGNKPTFSTVFSLVLYTGQTILHCYFFKEIKIGDTIEYKGKEYFVIRTESTDEKVWNVLLAENDFDRDVIFQKTTSDESSSLSEVELVEGESNKAKVRIATIMSEGDRDVPDNIYPYQQGAQATHKIVVKYDETLEKINNYWLIYFDKVVFRVLSTLNYDERNQFILFLCKKIEK